MKKPIDEYIKIYKDIMADGDVKIAYEYLMRYMFRLRGEFDRQVSNKYNFGNISPGYMDYTYFPLSNENLRNKKLRFGIVLNHYDLGFELWLMGRNEKIQKKYWDLLKDSKWNKDKDIRPLYSVLETDIIKDADFTDLDKLTSLLIKDTLLLAKEIEDYIMNLE